MIFQSACILAIVVLLKPVHITKVQSSVQSVFTLTILLTVTELYVVSVQYNTILSSLCISPKTPVELLYPLPVLKEESTVQSVFNKTIFLYVTQLTVVKSHNITYFQSLLSSTCLQTPLNVGQVNVQSILQSAFNHIIVLLFVKTNIFPVLNAFT